MREIKFRGKSTVNGGWEKGSLLLINEQALIVPSPLYDGDEEDQNVIPETVGQYTGLKDRNGTDIYEGDIVQEYVMDDLFVLVFTEYANFGLRPVSLLAQEYLKSHEYETVDLSYASTSLIVVGNIHDNPELLM